MVLYADSKAFTPKEAKRKIVQLIGQGKTIAEAMDAVGKSVDTYDYYRRTDKEFKDTIDFIRVRRAAKGGNEVPPFPRFCREYLHQDLFLHQLQWFDLIEGRTPREIHPQMVWEPGLPQFLLVNTPPEHAKSTTLTVNYVTWRILSDANTRVIIISKTQLMARKFLRQIKGRLTHPSFRDLQRDFAPEEGWKSASSGWTQDFFYLSDDERDHAEKDPTVQALGMGGHVYGARADLIILDDVVDGTNAHDFEKQIEWIQSEVLSRLGPNGRIILIGTRMAPQDLYSEIKRPERYPEEKSPWTYFAQPAVLEFADDPHDWVTLWPRSNVPEVGVSNQEPDEDGLYPKWTGPRLNLKRSVVQPRVWAMVYQQQQVVENATFSPEAVRGCMNRKRRAGRMGAGHDGHRRGGMEGLYLVAGLDPAMAGNTAAVLLGVDRSDRKRYVLDVFNGTTTPAAIRELIKGWTDRYGIHEWRVEKNAFQIMLTQDEEIRQYLANRGCILTEHFTGRNKWDADFGVASMAPLFGQWKKGQAIYEPLIELPNSYESEGVKALIEQLVTWYPGTKGLQDTVMALWFAEIRARELVERGVGTFHAEDPYTPRRLREQQMVVNLDEYAMQVSL